MGCRLVPALVATALAAGCGLVTVQQDPFPPLEIRADRPPPPPPRIVVTDSSIQIPEKIQFELGSDQILPVSFGLLDEIVAVIQDNPQIERLQIEGHTDSTGGAKRNRELSRQRAESVKRYFVDRGIAAGRLVAKGFGPDRPIADNATDDGREANRRVEFNILKQGPKKTVVTEE
jgi:outer membrane protein OmpA-like peptidoglycan-associated protein